MATTNCWPPLHCSQVEIKACQTMSELEGVCSVETLVLCRDSVSKHRKWAEALSQIRLPENLSKLQEISQVGEVGAQSEVRKEVHR